MRGIRIAVWLLVALLTIACVAAYVSGRLPRGSYSRFGMDLEQKLHQKERISSSGVEHFHVSLQEEEVELLQTDGEHFIVSQYGNEQTTENRHLFNVSKSDSSIYVSIPAHKDPTAEMDWAEKRMVIKVPRSYAGSIVLKTETGGIALNNSFSLQSVTLQTVSGGVHLKDALQAESLTVSTASGNIRVDGNVTLGGTLHAATTSGSQLFSGAVVAKQVTLSSLSGGVRMRQGVQCEGGLVAELQSGILMIEGMLQTNGLFARSGSGGVFLDHVTTETFDVRTDTGEIKAKTLWGKGTLSSTSGNITAGLTVQTGDLSAETTLGDIRLTTDKRRSFSFEASTETGTIQTDFDVAWADDTQRRCIGAVGHQPERSLKAKTTSGNITVTVGE